MYIIFIFIAATVLQCVLTEGKLELEFEIVTAEEPELRLAAKARDEHNLNPKLDPPNCPVTSFLWFTSPWKMFKFIIWKCYKLERLS